MIYKHIVFIQILLWLSVIIFTLGIVSFVLQLKKNKGKSVPEKLVIPSICLFLSITFLRYIVGFYEVVSVNSESLINFGYNSLHEVFNSIVRTMQTFSLDENYFDSVADGKKIFLNEFNSHCLSVFYGLFASFLNVCAPIIGGAFLLGILTSIFPRLRMFFKPFKEKYIFSEMNDRSVCFAEDIIEKSDKKPIIIFTDVYIDSKNEINTELLQRAKNIGAICINDDILQIKEFLYTKELNYILIDETDINNIHTLVTLVKEKIIHSIQKPKFITKLLGKLFNRKKRYQIYIFSQNPEINIIIRKLNSEISLKESGIVIRVVQEFSSIVYNLFDEVPLYYPLLEKYPKGFNEKKELILTIIGGGKIAAEAFLGAYWVGQILDCKLRINVLTENITEFIDKINFINRDILNSGKILSDLPVQNEKEHLRILRKYPNQTQYADPYAEFYFNNVNVKSDDFYEILNKKDNNRFSLLSSDYFIVAVGTDELNITTALNIDKMISKEILNENLVSKPVIAFSVFDANTNKIFSGNNIHPQTNTYLYAFASIKNIYSCKNIEMDHIIELAFDVNKSHREVLETDFYSDAYNYWSSIAQVLHYKYKVYSAGLPDKRNEPYDITDIEKKEYLNKIMKDGILRDKLTWLEHRRWNAFMRTKGFTAPTPKQWEKYAFSQNKESEKSHKNFDLKLHPFIVESTEIIQSFIDWDDEKYKEKKELDCLDIASIEVYQMKKARKKIDGIKGVDYKLYDTPDSLANKMYAEIEKGKNYV